MGNKERGEVSFKSGVKHHQLKLSVNSVCEMEAHYKSDIASIFERLEPSDGTPVRVTDIREIFGFMLVSDEKLSEEEVGEIMNAVGFKRATEIMIEAAQLFFPPVENTDDVDGEGEAGGKS